MAKEKILFSDLTFGSKNQILEDAEISGEVAEIAKQRGIVLPTPDIKLFKTIFAMADEENLNGCTMEHEDVSKALKTLVGKAVDLEHYRKETVGTWLDAKLEGNVIIAYGSLWVENYHEEADEILEDFRNGKLTVSFEAWGVRENTGPYSYKLKDIHFCGGALLRHHTQPACPQAFVQEFSEKGTRVLEFAKVMSGQDIEDSQKISDEAIEPKEQENEKNDGGNELMEEIKTVQEELAEVKAKNESLEEEKATLLASIEAATAQIADLTAKVTEQASALETVTAEKEEVIAKLDVYVQAEEEARKTALAEVAKSRREYLQVDESVTDEDLLDDSKYELMKTKKERDEAIAELAKTKKTLEISGEKDEKDNTPEWKKAQIRVAERAKKIA